MPWFCKKTKMSCFPWFWSKYTVCTLEKKKTCIWLCKGGIGWIVDKVSDWEYVLSSWIHVCATVYVSLTFHSYFSAERKAAIPLDDTTIKLSESYKTSLSSGIIYLICSFCLNTWFLEPHSFEIICWPSASFLIGSWTLTRLIYCNQGWVWNWAN